MPPKPAPPVCPACGQLDAVRKITALLSQETKHGTSATGMAGVSLGGGFGVGAASTRHHEQSELCRRLAQPKKPQAVPVSGCFTAAVVATILIGSVSLFDAVAGKPEARQKALSAFFVLTPICAAAALGLWWQWPKIVEDDRAKLARWQKAAGVWENGFYCGRCDGVFNIGDPEVETPEKALTL